MAAQNRRRRQLDVRVTIALFMQLALLWSLILTIISADAAALDPMCAAVNEWFCSPNDFDYPTKQQTVLSSIGTSRSECEPVGTEPPPLAYKHSSCALGVDDDPDCAACLKAAIRVIREFCPNKHGAQYGTEACCVRYERSKFC